MASAQLTERQQQIVDLQKEGKKAPEIATILGITPNGVYQQIRRMRDAKKTGSTKSAKPSTKPAKPTSTGTSTGTEQFALGQAKSLRPVTPLQSIRNRRDEIKAEIRSADAEREAAQRALAKAEEAATKLTDRYASELGNLDAAEAALKGTTLAASPKPPARAAKSPQASTPRPKGAAKNNGSGQAPAKPEATKVAEATPSPEAPVAPKPGPVAVG